jgi:hypothetical protein
LQLNFFGTFIFIGEIKLITLGHIINLVSDDSDFVGKRFEEFVVVGAQFYVQHEKNNQYEKVAHQNCQHVRRVQRREIYMVDK